MIQNSKFNILTPSGFKPFSGIQKLNKYGKITILLNGGIELKCASNHNILTIDGWKLAKDITCDDIILTKSGKKKVFFVDHCHNIYDFYDILGVPGYQYYTNSIISHNCEFLGSSNTLIDAAKLQQMVYKTPIREMDDTNIYVPPERNHNYVITVDVARGVEGDYSAFVVYDVSEYPYVVVSRYKSNEISPMLYPNKIYQAAKAYNEAVVLVEVNDIGQQVADILYYDLEYEGVLVTQTKGRGGQKIGGGFGGSKPQMGVKTTKQVKRIGCSNLKTLVEGDKLVINDYDIFYELTRFIEQKESYEAEAGSHDDLVMCCVLFAWLVNQSYFKDLFTTDVRGQLLNDNQSIIDDAGITFGFLNNHQPDISEFQTEHEFNNMDFHPRDNDFGDSW
jgi:hypothetical protein